MVPVLNYHRRKAYDGLAIQVHAPITSALDVRVWLHALAALPLAGERPIRVEKEGG
jgi:hypothetical protein